MRKRVGRFNPKMQLVYEWAERTNGAEKRVDFFFKFFRSHSIQIKFNFITAALSRLIRNFGSGYGLAKRKTDGWITGNLYIFLPQYLTNAMLDGLSQPTTPVGTCEFLKIKTGSIVCKFMRAKYHQKLCKFFVKAIL